jgi:sortase A
VRPVLRGLSTILIVAGSLLLVDAVLTLVWQEPVSAFLAQQHQNELGDKLDQLERRQPQGVDHRALAALAGEEQRIAFLARTFRRSRKEGDPIGRIKIPKIGASYVVVYGTSHDDLTKGPGLYPDTVFPGIPGTTAIAGHRTTYLAPFRHIDELKHGDSIEVEMPYGRFTYSVEKSIVVLPTALWITHRVGYDRLVLSACTPLYSASHRIIVFARLSKVEPRGAARGGAGQTLVEHPQGLSR